MPLDRRAFLSAVSTAALISRRASAQSAPPPKPVPSNFQAEPFPLASVKLLEGPFRNSRELNRGFLHRLPPDRLIHNFRVNASLPSTALPLGGWEKPDCELRGHFVGHYLSACAFMADGAGDRELGARATLVVAELAKCQQALGGGYLSAFPLEYFDRLHARKQVWAPFYTIHKIMAGLFDVHSHCRNEQALKVLEAMAGWADHWSAPHSQAHMQDILGTEFGGMSEVLYNLAAVTGKGSYITTADRFRKARFLDPLAARRDALKGLHVNTHVPQVIAEARRFELTSNPESRAIADYFWNEVTSARAYCTGGTSNAEIWSTDPRKLAEELSKSTNTAECCVAYNMLKLTRHLYQWTADPRYFDFYERILFNHRLGTLSPETGSSMYYQPLHGNSWKVFGSEFDSFWCCTGSGVEEHAKLNDSIYFHDRTGIFVNLFIPSEVDWPGKGLRLRQTTNFPDAESTTLAIEATHPVQMALRVRVPGWLANGGSARLNGKALAAFASPGSYFVLDRLWKTGDRVEILLPMALRSEPLPDAPDMVAFLKGPIVLAGEMSPAPLSAAETTLGYEPGLKQDATQFGQLPAHDNKPELALIPVPGQSLTYRAGDTTFIPLHRVFNRKYGVYWKIAPEA